MTVRIGLVGYGYWGSKVARILNSVPEVELVSIADVNRIRLELAGQVYSNVNLFSSHVDLLADDNIDAIWVATPVSSHFTVAVEALVHGKHTLVEKPIASNSEEALKMIEMARESDRVLMAGHTFIYDPTIRLLRRLLVEGQVGRVLYIESQRTGFGIFREDVDVIWDLASHDVSIFRYLLGTDPTSVCTWGNAYLKPPVTDVADLLFLFPDNVRAYVHVSWLEAAKRRQITIVGTKGMISYNDIATPKTIHMYKASVDLITSDAFGSWLHGGRYADIEVSHHPVPVYDSIAAECTHFVDCIKEQGRPLSDGYDGLYVVQILEAACASLMNGSKEKHVSICSDPDGADR